MAQIPNQYFKTDTVRTSDIDVRKRITIPALVRQLQEAAMEQVMQLKISVWDLEEDHLAWVLFRKHLEIFRLPVLGEEVQIKTNPAGFDRLFTFRDFIMENMNGKPLAKASSTWLLMNTKTRRPSRIPASMKDRFPDLLEEKNYLPRPKEQLTKWETASQKEFSKVHWHQLDFNQHFNNVQYFILLLDLLPTEILAAKQLDYLDIHFHAEAGLGDELAAELMPLNDTEFLHRLIRQSDNKVLAVAETKWK